MIATRTNHKTHCYPDYMLQLFLPWNALWTKNKDDATTGNPRANIKMVKPARVIKKWDYHSAPLSGTSLECLELPGLRAWQTREAKRAQMSPNYWRNERSEVEGIYCWTCWSGEQSCEDHVKCRSNSGAPSMNFEDWILMAESPGGGSRSRHADTNSVQMARSLFTLSIKLENIDRINK